MKTIVTDGLTFLCDSDAEVWRAQTLLTKEPGTITWLNANLQPGDVFYDIGANIGCYTLYAARLVGPTGKVYAFEPHQANVRSLLRNVQANQFGDRVQVWAVALNSFEAEYPFAYASLIAGSSGSQWGHTKNEHGREFTPVRSELMRATTIDALLALGSIRRADVVKIDVDGNEVEICEGMSTLLSSGVRSLQVEDNPLHRDRLQDVLSEYRQVGQHFTAMGQHAIERGAKPDTITGNAIFEKVLVAA